MTTISIILIVSCITLFVLLILSLIQIYFLFKKNRDLQLKLNLHKKLYNFYFQKTKNCNERLFKARKDLNRKKLVNKFKDQETIYKFNNLFFLIRTKIKELIKELIKFNYR